MNKLKTFEKINNLINTENILKKKILNQSIYYKFIIRNINDENLITIENECYISTIKNLTTFLTIKKNKNLNILGFTINKVYYYFQSISIKMFKFEFLFNKKIKKKDLNIYYNRLKTNIKNKKIILILYKIKGGYMCYYSGIIGFIKNKYINKIFNFNKNRINTVFMNILGSIKYISIIYLFQKKIKNKNLTIEINNIIKDDVLEEKYFKTINNINKILNINSIKFKKILKLKKEKLNKRQIILNNINNYFKSNILTKTIKIIFKLHE